ncbi:NAD(P)-binding protein [Candidatus Parabeggiatoa sp. HSG14]|uniref:NAD(P)-binding protein n=1 Tax=Candidatus Parabeggiatoa sp. HSG14 TaxID=3055593 RepID=UPI0025A8D710|nr:NAD(P)-binding protein [Thiotrichales bacterium HSG14]
MNEVNLTFRRYKDDDDAHVRWNQDVIQSGESDLCPTYIHRTPPCQGSCPSGHDVRGWLSIVRGLDKPPEGMRWEEYAFQRMTEANPFPAIMGRVCPAPCQDGCNRNEVENHVGINSVEQYIGDWARENNLTFPKPEKETGKKVAIVGGGPAGLAAAYFLRRRGHSCTIFESYNTVGGMMCFGIPGYRIPRDVLDHEVNRILDMGGIEVKTNTRVGTDVTIEQLEKEYDAIFWGVGATSGKALPITGAEAPNCVDGMAFLRAFNEGRLQHLSGRILVIGGGDTAMDVAAVARRIGHISQIHEKDRPENVILGQTVHDVVSAARRKGADVWLVYRRPISKAPATKHELEAIISEGVEIHESLAPLEVVLGEDGRAKALKVVPVDWSSGKMVVKEGEEFEIECSMIVGATGQKGDYTGIEEMDNGKGLIDTNRSYQVKSKPGHFVGGDAVKPHLLTTAIGHAAIAVKSMDSHLNSKEIPDIPKVNVHHFSLLQELQDHSMGPEDYDHEQIWGTNESNFAVHNYEDRSPSEIISCDKLFLGHFEHEPINLRQEVKITSEEVLSNFKERFLGLTEEKAVAEANRCMSCGMCFECNNCVLYCPQTAVFRVKKDKHVMGRYVDTDYNKCVGCYICRDVCPTGYIHMGLL